MKATEPALTHELHLVSGEVYICDAETAAEAERISLTMVVKPYLDARSSDGRPFRICSAHVASVGPRSKASGSQIGAPDA